MVKITIDYNSSGMSWEEKEEVIDRAIDVSTLPPGQLQQELSGVREVIIPHDVLAEMERAGISPDELVASLLKLAKASH